MNRRRLVVLTMTEYERVYRVLCAKIGVDPQDRPPGSFLVQLPNGDILRYRCKLESVPAPAGDPQIR